ncbi:MAG: Rhomboid family protein [Verrucomicrobia bacterium]|nr:Rhomboid family protein [Verrucomicrobiota bacterium]
MLSDRSYMRDNYPREKVSALTWLISATIAAFVLQIVVQRVLPFGSPGSVEHLFGLTRGGILAGRVWAFLTYGFLHDTNYLLHIVGNLLGLYFIGRILEPMLGRGRFLGLYFGAILLGGAAWLGVNWHAGGLLLGASAGVMGLFTVFACFYPNQPITFLLFFILPVTLKPKVVLLAGLLIDLLGCIFYEVLGAVSPFGLAHSAHLGGILAGWIYYRYVHEANWRLPSKRADIELPKWAKKAAKVVTPAPFQLNLSSKEDLKAEVDRILDKINSQGFGALSADEKRVLDEAKDLLSRR